LALAFYHRIKLLRYAAVLQIKHVLWYLDIAGNGFGQRADAYQPV
jgi:hypothetical protein